MRQRIRKGALIASLLLFPVTIWYFSPYLIIRAASEHVINGSFIVFSAMLILSMFLGRIWCAYLCPAGGLQECLFACNGKPAKRGWRDRIKYVIWAVWAAAVVVAFILGKNGVTVDPLYMTERGISISDIYGYIVYYGVVLIFALPPHNSRQKGFLPLPVLDGSVYDNGKLFGEAPAPASAAYRSGRG